MKFPLEDITSLIPQKAPFVMISSLIAISEKKARSGFKVSNDNVFVKDNIFQEAGLMENIAQTAALRAGYNSTAEKKGITLGYIGAVKELEIFSLPVTGDELETEVIVEDQIFNMTIISGQVWIKGKLIASCKINVITQENK